MARLSEEIRKLEDRVQQERDELRVQMHLFKADAKDQWAETEKQLDDLKQRLKKIRDETGDVTDDVGDALKTAAQDIVDGYKRIRKLF